MWISYRYPLQSQSMPRQVRIEYPDAIYHVMARGNRRERIVIDDDDRERFELSLEEVVEKMGWRLYAWVLKKEEICCI